MQKVSLKSKKFWLVQTMILKENTGILSSSDLKEKASDALLDYLDSVKTLDSRKTPLQAFRTKTASSAEISWKPAAHMPKELIKEFRESHPEIFRNKVYTQLLISILLIQLTQNLRAFLWQSDASTVAESVKTN